MLSRVAENLYWMARYLDRGENTARLINSTTQVLLDLPARASFGWHMLIEVAGLEGEFDRRYPKADEDTIIRFLIQDEDNPSSIISSIRNARENARTVREVLPMELWERINSLYLYVRENGARALLGRGPREEVLRGVIGRRESITGLFTNSMSRDVAYHFITLGRNVERADMTSRIVDVNSALQVSGDSAIAAVTVERAWISTLKALSALQMYRNHVGVHVRGREAVEFLLKDLRFPRTVRFCLSEVEASLAGLPDNQQPMKMVRKAWRRLDDMRLDGLTSPVLHEFLDHVEADIGAIHAAVARQYFNQQLPQDASSANQSDATPMARQEDRTPPMIDPLFFAAVRILTFNGQTSLTNASGFFFERDQRLFLASSRHVLYDEPSKHFPDRIEIELHVNADNLAESTGFSIPLYLDGKSLWRQGLDSAGAIDVAVIEIDRSALPPTTLFRAFTPKHLLGSTDQVAAGTPLVVVGFPLGFHDGRHHMPVARQAMIASPFGLRFQGEGYFLTDGRTHRGTSGSPVAMRLSTPDAGKGDLQWMLLGIHSARLDVGSRDIVLDEALGLNCAWYADILLTLTQS